MVSNQLNPLQNLLTNKLQLCNEAVPSVEQKFIVKYVLLYFIYYAWDVGKIVASRLDNLP